MVTSSRILTFALSAIFLTWMASTKVQTTVSQEAESPVRGAPIRVDIRTDQQKYSSRDVVTLYLTLENAGDEPTYVDRRMYWGGLAGGLKLEINDEKGNPVSKPFFLNDALMGPPKEGDLSILVRLDEGFFYGTSVNLPVKDYFPNPGRYSIRVIYKSWLRKEFVAMQLRSLPAVWADTPPIGSTLLWIRVVR